MRENGYGVADVALAREGASAPPSPCGPMFDLSEAEAHLHGLAPAAAAAVDDAGAPRFVIQWARTDLDATLAAARGDAPPPPSPFWAVDAARAARPAGREPPYAYEWGGKLIAKHLVLRAGEGWLSGELAGLVSATTARAARTAAPWHKPAAALRKRLTPRPAPQRCARRWLPPRPTPRRCARRWPMRSAAARWHSVRLPLWARRRSPRPEEPPFNGDGAATRCNLLSAPKSDSHATSVQAATATT